MKRWAQEGQPTKLTKPLKASDRRGMALSAEQEKRALYYMALFWFLGAAAYLKRLGLDPADWVASYAKVAERSSLLLSKAGNAAGVLRELAVIRRSVPGATPEKQGVPRWEGSAQEAARLVRAALRHFGAASIGFVELNERTRKLIYSVDPDGKALEFEDVAEASETKEKRVIPLRARWVVVYTVQMSEETLKRAPTPLGAQTTSLTYSRA